MISASSLPGTPVGSSRSIWYCQPMGEFSRPQQPIGPAPVSVHEVLRRPGQPLAAGHHAHPFGRRAAPAMASGPLQIGATGSASEVEAERLAGAIADGAERPAHPGWDLSQVRVHMDARASASAREIGARAYTVGTDIVFAEGAYQPSTHAGRRLIAHELVHVGQHRPGSADIVHRFEAPEHQDFGDRGLVELETFLQTKEGLEFGRKLGDPTALQDLRNDPFFQGKKFKVHGVELSAGDIIAMAGDFYASPADL